MRNQRGFQLISQSSINIKQQKNVNAIYIVPDAFFPFQYWLFFHVDIAGEAGVRCAWPVQHLQRLRLPITGKMAKLSTPKLQESLFYWFWTALLIYTAVFTLFTHAYLQGVWICANGKHAAGSEKTTFGLQINCKTKRIIWKTEKKNKGKNSDVCVSCLQSSFFVLSFFLRNTMLYIFPIEGVINVWIVGGSHCLIAWIGYGLTVDIELTNTSHNDERIWIAFEIWRVHRQLVGEQLNSWATKARDPAMNRVSS
jgi:hypothetical protein